MSYEDANAAIEARFNTEWADAAPVKWDNVEFEPTSGTSFVELQIHVAVAIQASIEVTPLHRAFGIISTNIYIPLNIGTKTADDHADTIAAIFRAATFSNVICRSPRIARLGEVDGWFIINVSVDFHYDKTY